MGQDQRPTHGDRPHVVILGAGASRAAFPNGDRHGYPLPLMTDLIQLIGLDDLVDDLDLEHYTTNFEEIYSHCHESGQVEIMKEMERRTYNYFDDMKLQECPTLYDFLILSLRAKDLIATFNWDPLLVQAAERNSKFVKPPKLVFSARKCRCRILRKGPPGWF